MRLLKKVNLFIFLLVLIPLLSASAANEYASQNQPLLLFPGGQAVGFILHLGSGDAFPAGDTSKDPWLASTFSGLGTLTFYSPQKNVFTAIGHPVGHPFAGGQVDTNQNRGSLDPASVFALNPSSPRHPGAKIGSLISGHPWGNITADGSTGLSGTLALKPTQGYFHRPLPLASPNQVHPGSAIFLTVLKGQKVQPFHILITSVTSHPQTQIAFRVVDPNLLRIGGGLLAGMSGSPIIQDGRLVGAVTRLLVADPSLGYGVFAWNMAFEAGILKPQN